MPEFRPRQPTGQPRMPVWLRRPLPLGPSDRPTGRILRKWRLATVCESALCPNRGECFARGTATFLILGRTCTRHCTFCAVSQGEPAPPDPDEPGRVREAARELKLRHAVVTSVARDDLPDGGAGHFAAVVAALRELPGITIEILTPDFGGNADALRTAVDALPHIFNHNLETVPRRYPEIRPGADYRRSLTLFFRVKDRQPALLTKSGLLVGFGETREEVREVLFDLAQCRCDIVTLGQYLRPSRRHFPVARYWAPEEFEEAAAEARGLGIPRVAAGPWVRSSYHAEVFAPSPGSLGGAV